MKKYDLLVIFVLIGLISFGQTPIKKVEKFPNGKIEHVYHVIQYKKIDQTYHTTDITNRKVGGTSTKLYLRHGSEKLYWENGNMRIETNYYKNLYNGKYKRYHVNGKLAEEGTWSYGTRKGVHKYFDLDGNLREEINFSNTSDYNNGNYKLFNKEGSLIADGKIQQEYFSSKPNIKESLLALLHGEKGKSELVKLNVFDKENKKVFVCEFSKTHPLRIDRYKTHPESFKDVFAILEFLNNGTSSFTKYEIYNQKGIIKTKYLATLDNNNNPKKFEYYVYYSDGKKMLHSINNEEQKVTELYDENEKLIATSPTIIEPFATSLDRVIWDIDKLNNLKINKVFIKMLEKEYGGLANTTHYYPDGNVYQKVLAASEGELIKVFNKSGEEIFSINSQDREFLGNEVYSIIGYLNFKTGFEFFIDKKYIRYVSSSGAISYNKKNIYKKYSILKDSLTDKDDLIKLYLKMFELLEKDTKEFEKLIKKEKDPSRLKELFEI